jgi:two-component system sensor histidine kinase KdpD
LACRVQDGRDLDPRERQLFDRAARRLGLALERESLERKSREADLLRESELLHQALLNSISHELRTPLTALMGSAAALREGPAADDPAQRGALLDEIGGAGERLNRVIENLLDMARLSSGVLALKKEWQDPAELARLTASRLKSPLCKHRLRLDLPEGMPLIFVDYRLIEHALSNLLLNAAVYSPPGGEITLSARAEGKQVEFSVSDQGKGVPPESLPRLFDKFYRVPGSPAGGTGLGLYITQSLMRAHGGDARAANAPSGGARFTLSLPLDPQPAMPMEAA